MVWTLLSVEISLALLGLVLLVLGLVLPDKGRRIMQPVTIVALLVILFLAWGLYTAQYVLFGGVYWIEPYSGFFKLLFLTAAILVALSAGRYVERFQERTNEFYSFLVFALLGMVVMASAGEMITLYIGLELMTISFYILTAYLLNDQISAEAGLKYLILGALSSAILLFGISLVYAATGTTVIAEMSYQFSLQPVMIAGIILIMAGFAFKVALVPFHMWAPDIYQGAPIPVTAFLAVGSKAAAFAAMVRVFLMAFPANAFDWAFILAVLAAITIVVGNLIALTQTDIKRLLAYSSIAQAGYIMVGLAAYNVMGLKGILFYAMLYVFSNMGAFTVATIVENETGSTEIQAFNGLAKRSPMLAAIMTVCLLSLAGIPPLAGFVGKFYLFSGAIESGLLWLAFVGLIMSMVSVYYYLMVAKAMYINSSDNIEPIKTGKSAGTALWICLAATLMIGLYPAPLSNLAQVAIQLFL